VDYVPRHIIHVQASWNTALVEGGAQGFDEGIDILGREELAVATDPRSVIEEGNESGLDRNAVDLDVGTVEGVGLPHFIGVGFGKSQALFVVGLCLGLEHVELLDDAGEGARGHLPTSQQPLFDTKPIEDGTFGRAAELGQEGVNGLLNHFQRDLADFAFVGTRFVFHDGDPVLLVAGVPRLDGTPGELAGMALLIGKGLVADGLDAGLDGMALGHVDGAQHAHFQIRSWISHLCLVAFFLGRSRRFSSEAAVFCYAREPMPARARGAVPCGVVAGWENLDRTSRARQFGPPPSLQGRFSAPLYQEQQGPALRISLTARP